MYPFLTQLFHNLSSIHIDLSGLVIDHITYRATTSDEGDALCAEWDAKYSLLKSAQINGREVLVYQCEPPIQYKQWSIPGLELMYPKPSKPF
jgi:predicted metalloenzyme YecM